MSRGPILLAIARSTLARHLGGESADEPADTSAPCTAPWLQELGATFVTLRSAGELRGCIGSIEATRPLARDLQSNAIAAATKDPRFPPLRSGELARVEIEVSLLSPIEALEHGSEEEVLATLRPGVDGLVLGWRHHRATLLPQVWKTLPSPSEFLAALKHKAGLKKSFWSQEVVIERYTVESWSEGQG